MGHVRLHRLTTGLHHETRRDLSAGFHRQANHRQPAPRARGGGSAVGILQGLHDKGVDLFLHQQGLDTSTTAGKAMFQMLGVFAEFERGIIRERVNAGLARAKAKGTKLGRRTVRPSVEARIRELKADGMGLLKIGRTVGVGTSVVQRVVADAAPQ
jgi:DNA invertase Pin-like site-specific DNA recombinase